MIGQIATIQNNLSLPAENASSPQDGCREVVFSEMEFLPWNNPHNIVSAEAETIASRLKNNLLVLFFLTGAPANVINMAVFYKQGLQDRVNLCLFALSLADEVYMSSSFVRHGEQLFIQFTTKERFGPVSKFSANNNLVFFIGFSYVSFALSAIIATERCLCVYNPLKFQRLLSTKTMAVIIIVVYVLVVGLFFLAAFQYRVGCVHDPVTDVTVITSVEGEFYRAHKQFIDILESFAFGIGLPGVAMTVVTTATIMTIVKLREALKWRHETSSSISAHELAVTKTLVANSIFFIICLLPGAVNSISWLFFPEVNSGKRHHNFFLMTVWISEIFRYINSTFNIVVYYVMGSRFRETFWALFGKNTKR